METKIVLCASFSYFYADILLLLLFSNFKRPVVIRQICPFIYILFFKTDKIVLFSLLFLIPDIHLSLNLKVMTLIYVCFIIISDAQLTLGHYVLALIYVWCKAAVSAVFPLAGWSRYVMVYV